MEVVLPPGLGVTGAILADQVKNVDWRARRASPIATAPETVVNEVLAKVLALVT